MAIAEAIQLYYESLTERDWLQNIPDYKFSRIMLFFAKMAEESVLNGNMVNEFERRVQTKQMTDSFALFQCLDAYTVLRNKLIVEKNINTPYMQILKDSALNDNIAGALPEAVCNTANILRQADFADSEMWWNINQYFCNNIDNLIDEKALLIATHMNTMDRSTIESRQVQSKFVNERLSLYLDGTDLDQCQLRISRLIRLIQSFIHVEQYDLAIVLFDTIERVYHRQDQIEFQGFFDRNTVEPARRTYLKLMNIIGTQESQMFPHLHQQIMKSSKEEDPRATNTKELDISFGITGSLVKSLTQIGVSVDDLSFEQRIDDLFYVDILHKPSNTIFEYDGDSHYLIDEYYLSRKKPDHIVFDSQNEQYYQEDLEFNSQIAEFMFSQCKADPKYVRETAILRPYDMQTRMNRDLMPELDRVRWVAPLIRPADIFKNRIYLPKQGFNVINIGCDLWTQAQYVGKSTQLLNFMLNLRKIRL